MSASISVPYAESRIGEWQGVRKKFMPCMPEHDVLRAMYWSRRALGEAWGRCAGNQADAHATWTAAVEGVWWALALDEELCARMPVIYPEARSQDPYGQTVSGLRWLRNRHAHEILVTGHGGPKKDFYGKPGDGYTFYISPSNRWKKRDDVSPRREEVTKAAETAQGRYDDYVAGWPLDMTLSRACIWFDRVFSACNYPPLDESGDKTVL
jgi:hypothetical protein